KAGNDFVILRFCSEAVFTISAWITFWPWITLWALPAWITLWPLLAISAWVAFWPLLAWISFCTLRASYVNKVMHILLSDNMTVNSSLSQFVFSRHSLPSNPK